MAISFIRKPEDNPRPIGNRQVSQIGSIFYAPNTELPQPLPRLPSASKNLATPRVLSCCNWSSDNCSWSPDKPDGFNFIPSCHRHDFGYRNTKAQKRFTSDMKTRIDDNFKKDLYKHCSQFSGIWSFKGVECRRIADIYVDFVQKLGKREGDKLGFIFRDNSGLGIDE
ncbi:hypothetical protein H633G_04548 [Metarhizium anisopliae BRIP 53284]|nr:hypothetical protein H633G_04548 [Metarhizium anisopliae BRIP 53284]